MCSDCQETHHLTNGLQGTIKHNYGWAVESCPSSCFFPTCQVRLSRFYQGCFRRLLLLFLLRQPRTQPSTASSRSQWARPDLRMSDRMPERMPERMPDECLKRCQIDCQNRCQIKNAGKNVKIYARNYVRIDAR